MRVVNINDFMEGWDRNKVTNGIGKMNKMWSFCGLTTTSKKSLFLVELMCDLPYALTEIEPNDSFSDEFLFLISTKDPWYGYLIIYLQTQRFQLDISCDDHCRIHHHAKYYLILNDTLYRHGINSILWWRLTHEEVEQVSNDYHSRACGNHLSRMATA